MFKVGRPEYPETFVWLEERAGNIVMVAGTGAKQTNVISLTADGRLVRHHQLRQVSQDLGLSVEPVTNRVEMED